MNASDLTRRATFLKPETYLDEDFQPVQGYVEQFTCAAHVHYLRGGEEVMAARLQSKSPAVVTIRDSATARQVTSEWRVRIGGRTFEMKEDPRPDQARRLLEMLVEA